MSYSFQKAHSYLINSLQVRGKMFTETGIESSFPGIGLKRHMRDAKSALPRTPEANSAGLGPAPRQGTSLGKEHEHGPFSAVRNRCKTLRGLRLSPNFTFSSSRDGVGRGQFHLESPEPTPSLTVLVEMTWPPQAWRPSVPESLILSFPFHGPAEVWEPNRSRSLPPELWVLRSRSEKCLLTSLLFFGLLSGLMGLVGSGCCHQCHRLGAL